MGRGREVRRGGWGGDGLEHGVEVACGPSAARAVALDEGLAEDWLNDAVKGFLPGDDPHATVLFDEPGLTVRIASPRYLFAMKAVAARVDRDADDLRVLFRLCAYRGVDAALDDVASVYPSHLLPPTTRFLLEELLGDQAGAD